MLVSEHGLAPADVGLRKQLHRATARLRARFLGGRKFSKSIYDLVLSQAGAYADLLPEGCEGLLHVRHLFASL
jgi:hypothetical protein